MKCSLTPEVAMAIQKGDINYARLLSDMGFVRETNSGSARPHTLTASQAEGRNFILRRLRDKSSL